MDTLTITRNLRDDVILITDNDAVNILTLTLDEGNFEATETPGAPINIRDRGILDHVRTGDEEPVTISLGAMFTQYIGAGTDVDTIADAIRFAAPFSWSSAGSTGEPNMLAISLIITNPGTTATEIISYDRLVPTQFVIAEGDEFNTIRLEGTAFVTTATVTSSSTG